MAETIFDKDNTNLDTSTENIDRDFSGRSSQRLWHLVNDTTVDVKFEFFGTYNADDDFSDAVSLGSTTVSGDSVDYDSLNLDAWEQVRIEVTPQSDPTNDNVEIHEMAVR